MQEEIFSVVTPSFNQGKFISETINSIFSQAGNFFIDYIIMDGGSKDETISVIKNYENILKTNSATHRIGELIFFSRDGLIKCKGISFRWYSENDRGQSHAINKGYQLTVGKYFSWLNSDDKLLPNSLDKVKTVLSVPKNLIVFGGCQAFDSEGKFLWEQNPAEVTIYNMLYKGEGVPQPSVFWKKKLSNDRDFLVKEELKYTMDTELWLHFLKKKYKWIRIPEVLSIQIYHSDSKSCEGDSMFQNFVPENDLIKGNFRKSLGFVNNYFNYLKKIEHSSRTLFKILKMIYYR